MAKPNSAAGIAGFLSKTPTPPRSPLADDMDGVAAETDGPVPSVPEQAESVEIAPSADESKAHNDLAAAGDGRAGAPASALEKKFLLQPDTPLVEIEHRITTVTNEYVVEVGRLLEHIRNNELWKKSGTPYTSWSEYVRVRWEWAATYANMLIRIRPVVELVSPRSDRPVNAGQGEALHPVWKGHGEQAALEVWNATPGKRSAAALVRVAIAKGYLEAKEAPSEHDGRRGAASPIWQRYEPVLPVVEDLRGLRDLTLEAPEKGIQLAFYFARAFQEIKGDLDDDRQALLDKAVLEGQLPAD